MPLPINTETATLAARVIWFEPPQQALSHLPRFLAYAFRYATHADMRTVRRYLTDDELREALDRAPPGIIDPRSWSYWRLMLDLPARPLPIREFA